MARTKAEQADPTRYDPRYDGLRGFDRKRTSDDDAVSWRDMPLPWMIRKGSTIAKEVCRG